MNFTFHYIYVIIYKVAYFNFRANLKMKKNLTFVNALTLLALTISCVPNNVQAQSKVSNLSLNQPSITVNQASKFTYLSKEDVLPYINEANDSQIVDIDGLEVKYYYGDSFVVGEEENGYVLITFNEDKSQVTVNGREIESRVVDKPIASNFIYGSSAANGWTHYNTKYREYNIVGLVPSAIGGLIGGAVGQKAASLAVGSLSGLLVSGMFPEYYISVRTEQYYDLNQIVAGKPKTRDDAYVYHGPKYDRYQNFWFSIEGV